LNRYIKALLVAALLISLVGAVGAKNETELREFLKSDTTEANCFLTISSDKVDHEEYDVFRE
jgi:hypothetical protein